MVLSYNVCIYIHKYVHRDCDRQPRQTRESRQSKASPYKEISALNARPFRRNLHEMAQQGTHHNQRSSLAKEKSRCKIHGWLQLPNAAPLHSSSHPFRTTFTSVSGEWVQAACTDKTESWPWARAGCLPFYRRREHRSAVPLTVLISFNTSPFPSDPLPALQDIEMQKKKSKKKRKRGLRCIWYFVSRCTLK